MPYKDPAVRKEKAKLYSKNYYNKNKHIKLKLLSFNKAQKRIEWDTYKASFECTTCGENHPATLDFHHLVKDPTNKKINALTRNGAYKKAREEIKNKCIVLCANCHRKHHYEERKIKA